MAHMTVAEATTKMIAVSKGNVHDIDHFLKVWALARTIGLEEDVDAPTQETLELAALVHDIACPLCREKYGNTAGPLQERESEPLVREFLSASGLPERQVDRIAFLVGHHHTYKGVEGDDRQILLEADFIVNAGEMGLGAGAIASFRSKVFKTRTGRAILDGMFLSGREDAVPDCPDLMGA